MRKKGGKQIRDQGLRGGGGVGKRMTGGGKHRGGGSFKSGGSGGGGFNRGASFNTGGSGGSFDRGASFKGGGKRVRFAKQVSIAGKKRPRFDESDDDDESGEELSGESGEELSGESGEESSDESAEESSDESAEKSDLHTQWHNSIAKLLETGINSDCTLMVGGEQLKAHRLILSAISPTFAVMFGNDGFQEARDGIVRIEDSTAKAARAMLDFAYKGCIDWARYSDCKRDVLILACKYLIDALKHHVERLLVREITAESFTELAILADRYSCKQLEKACVHFLAVDYPPEKFVELVLLADENSADYLKKACVEYLSDNLPAVVLTPQWGVLTEERGAFAKELLRRVRKSTASTAAGGGPSDCRDDEAR